MRLGELSRQEIDQVIGSQVIGRLGCHADGRTYVVPIVYAYDGEAVYVHSYEGKKLQMMRKSPDVCLEVEDVHSPNDWKSVLAWGRFEELSGAAAAHAYELLDARCPPPSHEGSVFRVRLDETTGRFAASGD
jgi:hypothetical protein